MVANLPDSTISTYTAVWVRPLKGDRMAGVLKTWITVVVLVGVFGFAIPANADPNCTCRYKGQSYALESCICLSTSAGPRLACCGMVLNNTSWNFTDRHCPVVERPVPKQTFAVWSNKAERRGTSGER